MSVFFFDIENKVQEQSVLDDLFDLKIIRWKRDLKILHLYGVGSSRKNDFFYKLVYEPA